MFTVKLFLLLRVCKDLLLKLSIAHHYILQSAKITQLGLSTIIPILKNNSGQRRTLKLSSYLKPLRNIQKNQYEQRVVKSRLTEHLSSTNNLLNPH